MNKLLKLILSIFRTNPQPSPAQTDVPSNSEEPTVVQPTVIQPTVQTVDDFAAITKFTGSSDCRSWPITAKISSVKFNGKNFSWQEDSIRDSRWNRFGSGKIVNGDIVILIPSLGVAGAFDFLGVGQKNKTAGNLVYKDEREKGIFYPWNLPKGEIVGICITTISRDKRAAKMKERSNVEWVTL